MERYPVKETVQKLKKTRVFAPEIFLMLVKTLQFTGRVVLNTLKPKKNILEF